MSDAVVSIIPEMKRKTVEEFVEKAQAYDVVLKEKKVKAAAIRSTKLFLLQSQPFPDSGNRYMQGRAMLPRHAIWI